MTDNGLSLDHVGFMVYDLDTGEARWRKLGFLLAPRSPQMGALPDGTVMAPWATSNHCAMFQQGYLELIGVTDPTRHNPWTAFLNRYEGIHITAFRCPDADTAYAALTKRTDGFDPPLQRRRDAPYGDGVREFRFRNIFSQDDRYPEGRFIVIEHQTPEVIWQPPLMTHPNGAIAFDEVVFCGNAATLDRIGAITGVPTKNGQFPLPGGGTATVLSEAAFSVRFQGARPPALPCAAAAVIAVSDIERTRDYLSEAGIQTHDSADSSCWVPAEDANGGIIAFKQS